MATDARISTAFPSHPKTKKLRRRLGDSGPLGCMYLFLWAAANRSDGDLSGLSDEDIELAVDWEGDHGALVAEMVAVGFLDGDEGSRRIHDWAEHNPWAAGAEARSEKARWAALCKQHGRREAARMMPEYAERLLDASPESATSTKDSATSKLGAVLDGASSTPLAGSGSAPSPSPSPSPSPRSKSRTGASAPTPEQLFPEADPNHLKDWMVARRAKRLPLTETAAKGFRREAEKAGLSAADAVKLCAERGWAGINSGWQGAQAAPAPARKRTML